MCVYVHVSMCVSVCFCVSLRLCIYLYVCMYACVYICTYIYMYTLLLHSVHSIVAFHLKEHGQLKFKYIYQDQIGTYM